MSNGTSVKVCKRCGESKSFSEYHYRYGKPIAQCKTCRSEVERERYQRDRDRILAQKREYLERNREAIHARQKKFREENPELVSERKRKYYEENREYILEWMGKYQKAHAQYYRDQARQWYLDNRERALAYRKAWSAAPENREKIRGYRRKHSRTELGRKSSAEGARRRRAKARSLPTIPFTREQLEQRVEYYGGKCWICGEADYEHMDHVKPISKGGAHMLSNLRPACAACNLSKFNKWPWPLREAD